ncbi:TIGR03943 family putative permease subunit [Nakamurella sp. GG22]
MNKETQSIVVTLLGGLLVSITLSGRFTSYVKPGFAPLLLIGGGILIVVGVLSLILAIRADVKADRARKQALAARASAGGATQPHADHVSDAGAGANAPETDAHGHDHASSKSPWLILVPVLVLLLVAPPALGADAVARNASSQALAGMTVVPADQPGSKDATGGGGYKFNDGSGSAADSAGSRRTMHFPALEGQNPTVGLKDLILRALYDADYSVRDVPVTVTGFLAPAGQGYGDGYTIARMVISCCAADANPMQLHVAGEAPYPANTWVQAVVTVDADTATLDNGYVPTVSVGSMTPVEQPSDPYEH